MDIFKTIKTERSVKSEYRHFEGHGRGRVVLRFDDRCGNGHNTFSITVDAQHFGGCMHAEIAEVFPEYAHLIKWHLVSTDGPLHYIANTLFHARNGQLRAARSSAVAPEATLDQLQDEDWLNARLPALLRGFRDEMKLIGWES